MGRRALPKIPAGIDLTDHLLDLRQLHPPLRRDDLFPTLDDMEVEVGSGKGLFLANAAETVSERAFLGIEVAGKYARFIAYRLARKQLANAKIVHGDAEQLFREFLADHSIFAVHIYFPDPWWKKRHHKRRIMNEAFLHHVTRVLKPGGKLHFWTDVEPYYREALDLIRERIGLDGPLSVPEAAPQHDLDYRTHFERRKRQAGLAIFRAEFVKP